MDNEQFNEFIRQLKEYYKKEQERIQGIKETAASEALIDKAVADERFWRFIASEMDKRVGESEKLGGMYNIDLAKKMLPTLPKEQVLEFMRTYLNQQNPDSQQV
jgi:hypothetical protein